MSGYSKLWSEIVTSSIWAEDDKTRIVWVTMLALKDQHGYVAASLPGLSHAARVDISDCEKALAILEAPDKYSRSTEHEGRRIERVDGGWLVLNHLKYRDRKGPSTDPTAAERQKRYRERHASNGKVTDSNGGVTLRNVTPVSVYVSESASSSKEGMQGEIKTSADFAAFWEVYPRKVAKKAALKAWQAAKDKPDLEKILQAISMQCKSESWRKDGGAFIPHPSTWINQGRWDDQPAIIKPKVNAIVSHCEDPYANIPERK